VHTARVQRLGVVCAADPDVVPHQGGEEVGRPREGPELAEGPGVPETPSVSLWLAPRTRVSSSASAASSSAACAGFPASEMHWASRNLLSSVAS
jgi:hypothetical protein